MAYKIKYQKQAVLDAARLQRSDPNAFKKLLKLESELREHPRTGTGHPEQLRGDRSNQWNRHITQKHRLVYEIYDTEVVVLVLTAYGHYEDK
jgi:toxin YoeB